MVNVVFIVNVGVTVVASFVVFPDFRADCILVQLDIEVELFLAYLLEHVVEHVKVLASELSRVSIFPSTNLLKEEVDELESNEIQLAPKGTCVLPFPSKFVLSLLAWNFIEGPVIRVGSEIMPDNVGLVYSSSRYDDE